MLFLEELPVFYIILAICVVVPIFVLIIVAFIIALIKRIKMAKKYNPNNKQLPNEQATLLLSALGENNIISVNVEMSRLTIEVKDVDLVQPEKIKEAGANGVLLVGNKVKCSFGDKAEEISKLLQ